MPEHHRSFGEWCPGSTAIRCRCLRPCRAAAGGEPLPIQKMFLLPLTPSPRSQCAAHVVGVYSLVMRPFGFAAAITRSGARFSPDGSRWSSLWPRCGLLTVVAIPMLGLIGAYLGRCYDQSKGRPLFLIRDIVVPPTDSLHSKPAAAGSPPGPLSAYRLPITHRPLCGRLRADPSAARMGWRTRPAVALIRTQRSLFLIVVGMNNRIGTVVRVVPVGSFHIELLDTGRVGPARLLLPCCARSSSTQVSVSG